jgi:subtilisin family serine protease
MKAVVSKYLNVRSGEPKVLPDNNIGNKFFRPGETIEISDKVEGETYKGNNVWYKLSDGTFVWSGGVDNSIAVAADPASNSFQPYSFIEEKMSWAHKSFGNGDLGIVDMWNTLGTKGNGASICVIDTGLIDKPNDFGNVKGTAFRNVFDTILDDDGHGTNCASIAAATGTTLYGVAPETSLYIYKSFIKASGQTLGNFTAGFQDLLSKEWPIDVLSISFSYPTTGNNQLSIDLISKLSEKYIILVSIDHLNSSGMVNNDQFPASLPNVIAVCAADANHNLLPSSYLSKKAMWVFPGDEIECLNKLGQVKPVGQSSIATPIAAGFIALLISYMRKKGKVVVPETYKLIIQFLSDNSELKTVNIPNDTTGAKANYYFLSISKVLANIDNLLK